MEVERILRLYLECTKAVKTVKGAECDRCPLARDVSLTMAAQTPETGVLSEVSMKVYPCFLITEVARQL